MDELRDQMELLGCEDDDWPEEEDEQEYEHDDCGRHGGNEQDEGGQHGDEGPDDLTCAICLGQIQPLDLALVKGCEHQYCVHCILQWSMHKEWCPQCKAPFSYLYTHRHLDGTPSDYPLEESVTLLKRARWFVEEHEAREKAKELALGSRRLAAADAAAAAAAAGAEAAAAAAGDGTDRYHAVGDGTGPPSPRDWCDLYEDMVDAELEEDEAIEDFYYSSAAGRARIVLGNRRWGHGGFMRSGRMFARPVNPSGASGNGASTSTGDAAQVAAAPAGGKSKVKPQEESSPPAPLPAGKGKGKAKAATGPKIPKCAQAHHAWAPDGVAPAAVPAASPLGRSPCSYGSAGGVGGWMAHAAALGTSPCAPSGGTPGSGRRAKRNARRAAADVAA